MSKREEFEPTMGAYLELVRSWRNDLNYFATSTLEKAQPDEENRAELEGAIRSLGYVDELVKILQKLPNEHQQVFALQCLWNTITASFIVGSRGVRNPVLENLTAKTARAGKRADEFDKIVAEERDALWKKKPIHQGNNSATATEILDAVNKRLRESGIKEKKQDAIRHSLRKLKSA